MITKLPIFTHSIFRSNIHRISYLISHLYVIKIHVSSNHFELTSIVCIFSLNSIRNTIFYHFLSFPLNLCNFIHCRSFWGISAKFPLNFLLRKNLVHFPFVFSDQIKNVFTLTVSTKLWRS